jgi:hypothetical protein
MLVSKSGYTPIFDQPVFTCKVKKVGFLGGRRITSLNYAAATYEAKGKDEGIKFREGGLYFYEKLWNKFGKTTYLELKVQESTLGPQRTITVKSSQIKEHFELAAKSNMADSEDKTFKITKNYYQTAQNIQDYMNTYFGFSGSAIKDYGEYNPPVLSTFERGRSESDSSRSISPKTAESSLDNEQKIDKFFKEVQEAILTHAKEQKGTIAAIREIKQQGFQIPTFGSGGLEPNHPFTKFVELIKDRYEAIQLNIKDYTKIMDEIRKLKLPK